MMFDLYNLAPSIGQVNALRLNDRYADLPDDTSDFGNCPIENSSGLFEPPDCLKGGATRVWLVAISGSNQSRTPRIPR